MEYNHTPKIYKRQFLTSVSLLKFFLVYVKRTKLNKIYIFILVIIFGGFTLYTIHMQYRDRSNAPTWAEVECAIEASKCTYKAD